MGTRITLLADGGNSSDILASMLGIMKIGCIADLNGSAEITADFSVLTDEEIPCLSPGAFAVPDEPALAADGQILTGRELAALSEELLKKNHIYAGKSLTIYGRAFWHGILGILHPHSRYIITEPVFCVAAFKAQCFKKSDR